jgi:hypothetical protein
MNSAANTPDSTKTRLDECPIIAERSFMYVLPDERSVEDASGA